LKLNIPVTAREASFNLFCSTFFLFSF